MDSMDDYLKWKAKRQKVATATAVEGLRADFPEPPDKTGQLMQLGEMYAQETGNRQPDVPLVREYGTLFEKELQAKRAEKILAKSPMLAEWLRQPDNAAIGRDDLDGLSWWETGLGNSLKAGVKQVEQAGQQAVADQRIQNVQDQQRSFGEIVSDAGTIRGPDGKPVYQSVIPGPLDLITGVSRFATSRLMPVKMDDALAAQMRVGDIANQIAALPMSPEAQKAFDDLGTLAPMATPQDAIQVLAGWVAGNPLGVVKMIAETGLRSLPPVAAGVTAGAVTKNPTVAASVMGGTSFAMERYSAPTEFYAEKGIDVSTPEGAMAVISNPELMQEAARRGVLRGVVIGAMDGLSGGVAGQTLAKSRLGNMLLQSVTQAAMGAAGETGGQLAAGQQLNFRDILLEALGEFATSPLEVAGMSIKSLNERMAAAKRAKDESARLAEVSKQSQQSKTRQRSPERFRRLVDAATVNGPVESVYVPAETFVQYFQSQGLDPYELADSSLTGVTRFDLETAVASGGDLKIPTSTYAARLAGTEHDAFLMENMKFDPEGMTFAEAQAFNEIADEARQAAFDEAERLRQEFEDLKSYDQQIYETMNERLRVAGRAADVASAEASLYPAFYRTMAERSEMTMEEFAARYPLPQVRGSIPQGMQDLGVDGLDRQLAEARKRRAAPKDNRQTLLEFISDAGGIFDARGELKARNADQVKRKGKKTLKLRNAESDNAGQGDMVGGGAERQGFDVMARKAMEAGFLAGDPRVDEYRKSREDGTVAPDLGAALLDAIDRELAGQPEYSINDGASADGGSDLESYLDSLGVSLDNTDAEIKAAVDADQSAKTLAQGERGAIQIPAGGIASGESVIRLFERADLSTFLHESGHYFLSVLRDMAARGEESSIVSHDALKTWWASEAAGVARDGNKAVPGANITPENVKAFLAAGTAGDAAKDQAIDAGMQEQFARGFEQYLMDGKAPSVELRGAFERFRAWLVSIYKRLKGLNVNVSPELRDVFDRMLASDAEIEKAKDRTLAEDRPDMTAEQLGLSPEDYAKLTANYARGADEAKAHMLREIMAPLKRDREKWFRDERAKVRAEMETAVNAKPVYRAIEWMGNGRWLGDEPQTGLPDMRLSKQILIDRYGEGVLDTLRKGRSTVYAASGGMDPDEAAGWFGFSSGDMLVRAIENAMPRRDAIEAETDREMRDRYGDLMTEGDIEAEAINAVHNDAALNALVKEYAALAALAGTPNLRMSARDARHAARLALARMTVRDAVKPNRFLAAERKAREESRVLSGIVARDGVWLAAAKRRAETGVADESFAPALRNNRDVMRLLQAKERAILNHALFEESRKVADEVAAAEKLAARLGKKSVRERLATAGRRGAVLGAENGIDYLGAIDELLEQYSFRKTSGRADQRQGAFRAYIDAMTAAGRGNELSVADDVLRRVAQVPYKTLKVEELRGVTDALKNLVHIAGRWNKLIDAKLERDLDAAVEGVTDAVVDNLPAKPPARFANKSESRFAALRQYLNIVLTATTLLREIDGFKDQGAAYTAIKAPIDDAMNRLQLRKEKAAADLEQLYSVYSKDERRAMAVRNHNPIIGEAVSKWEIIAIALNTGNEDNLQRLTDRRVKGSFSPMQVEAAVSSLSKKDWDFVQSVWDYINTYWPDIAEREKRATGTVPAKVEAKAVETPHGIYRGGYYPIKSDARLSNLAADDEGQNIANALALGKFGKAQTRNGHTKARATSSGRALDLDMSVLHRHINQVIYDLELSEPVANSWRILHDGRTRDAFRAAGRNTDHATLETWLKDVAEGELRSSDLVNVMARKFKSNFTAAKLAINMGVVLSQVAGISQSMVVLGKRDFAKGASLYISNPSAAVESVVARSPFMASRQTTFNKDIGDYYNDPKSGPAMSRYQEIRQKIIGPLAFWLMTKVQFLAVDMPTWMGGYEQGLRLFGNDEAKAIAHADDVVKRAQASGLFSDRSAIERGSLSDMSRQNDVVRLFTTLGSYMFAKFNIAYEKSVKAGRVVRSEGASLESFRAAMSWTADMVMLFTVDAVILAAIKGRLPGDDDDDGTVADDWAAFLAKETGFGMAGTLPFVRDIAGTVGGFQAGGAYGGIIHDLANPFVKMGSGKIDKSLLKSIANASAVMFGIPGVTQINKVIDAAARQAEGEDVSPMEYLLGKPPKK